MHSHDSQRSRTQGGTRAEWASRGLLVTITGLDGSGKTTAAKRLVNALRARGHRAAYFYAHRPSYHKEKKAQGSFSIAFKGVWRRVGHAPEELGHHPWLKVLLDFATFLDHLVVLARLSVQRQPGTLLIVDRYVPDVIAYLRFLGPTSPAVERLIERVSADPDVAVFFDIDPESAYARKQEQTLGELERFARIYEDLRRSFPFVPIDARPPINEVLEALQAVLERELRLASPAGQAAAKEAIASSERSEDVPGRA